MSDIAQFYTLIGLLIATITLIITLNVNLKADLNKRMDSLKADLDKRIDDLKNDHNSLSVKIDNLTAQVNKLEGAVHTILFIIRPHQADPEQEEVQKP